MSGVLSQCNTRIRLLHLLHDIDFTRAKQKKPRFFSVLHSDKTWVFDQSERAQGAIYVIIINMAAFERYYRGLQGDILLVCVRNSIV